MRMIRPLPAWRRLAAGVPAAVSIRLIVCPNILGANVKVSNLAQMLPAAQYEYLIVNDSDIRVERGLFATRCGPLRESEGWNGDLPL